MTYVVYVHCVHTFTRGRDDVTGKRERYVHPAGRKTTSDPAAQTANSLSVLAFISLRCRVRWFTPTATHDRNFDAGFSEATWTFFSGSEISREIFAYRDFPISRYLDFWVFRWRSLEARFYRSEVNWTSVHEKLVSFVAHIAGIVSSSQINRCTWVWQQLVGV